ncbi:MAG TPA: MFS transporter [Acidimicrobiales bacterium]|nr:MFS transporter [Acidimicrobiales bacterium]
MTRLRGVTRKTFAALSVRNYRLYFTGQVISVSGTWMQMVAQTYLILFRLHGTGVDVAIATGLQFLPMLLFGTFGGLIADRLDKRKLLYATQASAGALALAFGLLVVTNAIRLDDVFLLAALLGVVNLFDNPARQTFVSEMVGRTLLPNAVSLNSVVMNGARVIGPGIGGVLILTLGVSTCFMINAASYVAVLVALSLMRTAELHPAQAVVRGKGQVRQGLRYAWATPDLRNPLLSMVVVGIFAFNFTVTLPLLAKFSFHGGAGLYSTFLAAMGGGAVVGGLFTAHRSRPSQKLLAVIGFIFGALILAVALAPTTTVAIILLIPMGAASISFIATNNAILQLRSEPSMRGRVMSLNAIAFLGSTPIGAPLLGWISDVSSPRVAFTVGGVATLLASIPLVLHARNARRAEVATVLGDQESVAEESAEVVTLPVPGVRSAQVQRRLG